VYLCTLIFSGGTEVTIEGSDLNSVAEPHITLTVIVTRFDNDTNTTSTTTDSNMQVNGYV